MFLTSFLTKKKSPELSRYIPYECKVPTTVYSRHFSTGKRKIKFISKLNKKNVASLDLRSLN